MAGGASDPTLAPPPTAEGGAGAARDAWSSWRPGRGGQSWWGVSPLVSGAAALGGRGAVGG
eukprot:14151099-Alexandrium_andersonii.AAC.1